MGAGRFPASQPTKKKPGYKFNSIQSKRRKRYNPIRLKNETIQRLSSD